MTRLSTTDPGRAMKHDETCVLGHVASKQCSSRMMLAIRVAGGLAGFAFCFTDWMCAAEASGRTTANAKESKKIEQRAFGKLPDGTEVQIYTLTNQNGMVAKVTE